jgi:hypothetical protein
MAATSITNQVYKGSAEKGIPPPPSPIQKIIDAA